MYILKFHYIELSYYLLISLVLSIITFPLILKSIGHINEEVKKSKGLHLFIIIFIALNSYFFGGLTLSNHLFIEDKPKLYRCQILGKTQRGKDKNNCDIVFKDFRDQSKEIEMDVNFVIYNQYDIGDSANILVYEGLIGLKRLEFLSNTKHNRVWWKNEIIHATYPN
jgi:hypothetical protein